MDLVSNFRPQTQPPYRTWIIPKFLSRGAHGSVYLVLLKSNNFDELDELFAVKRAPLEDSTSLEKERRIYCDLNSCPEIIRSFGSKFTVKNDTVYYNLVLEYAPAGTLSNLISQSPGGVLPETTVRIFIRMILKGLSYIHAKGYVHCDLKPDNILAFPSDQNQTGYRLKLADFGLTREPGEVFDEDYYKLQFRGTPLYMSHESVAFGEIEPALDIWSLGCIVVEMCTGREAWQPGRDYDDQIPETFMHMLAYSEKTPQIPQYMSKDGKDFLRKCFARDYPRRRWSAQMLLHHPYVSEANQQHRSTSNSPVEPLLENPEDTPSIFSQEFHRAW